VGALLALRTRMIFVTASLVRKSGKAREVVVESRPQYAVIQLKGSREKYSIAWEAVYELARRQHDRNLRLEAKAVESLPKTLRRKAAM
jgi:hypothetical protein